MPPPTLPPHLSRKVALVLLPPNSITTPIESIRRQHDKHFHRWPPHINLIYPFLSNVSSPPDSAPDTDHDADRSNVPNHLTRPSDRSNSDVYARIRRALTGLRPFTIHLSKHPQHFQHSKRSSTVWLQSSLRPSHKGVTKVTEPVLLGAMSAERESAKLDPDSETEIGPRGRPHMLPVQDLQARLQAEFTECDADLRRFTPHLSLGQAGGSGSVEALGREAREVVEAFLAEGEGHEGHEARDGETDERKSGQADGLEWNVDRVFVIERRGFKDRFKIVGEVELGQA